MHIDKSLIEKGLKAADSKIFHEDKIWSRYSNDKVDIGEELAKVIRVLNKAFSLSKALSALSIGSSNEPQFRILETAFRKGLYLFDVEEEALDIIKERINRQLTTHVTTILGDYNKTFLDSKKTKLFLKKRLKNEKVNFVAFHHSLYYSEERNWLELFTNVYREILAKKGAIHTVLMAAESDDPYSTTWLYNYFAGKFFGCHNDQNLLKFKNKLKEESLFKKAEIFLKTNYVQFSVDDFEKLMAVIWMILLYPNVHQYSLGQREEITEFIYKNFWIKKRPLIQAQDHLVIYRGIDFKGLV